MPMFHYSKGIHSPNSSWEYIMAALNLNARYQFMDTKRWTVHGFGFGGYMKKYNNKFETGFPPSQESLNILDIAAGAATQFKLGQNGWSIDLTLGLMWLDQINGAYDIWQGFLTFGVFKRFGRPAK